MDIMRQALMQAREGRRHILGEMAKCYPPPREQLSDWAPKILRSQVCVCVKDKEFVTLTSPAHPAQGHKTRLAPSITKVQF